MAAAIGLGASIITVIQLTAQLTSLSYQYISGVKHARDEIQSLLQEIKSLSIVLTNLNVCAQGSSGSALWKELEDPLRKCTIDIRSFLTKLEPRGWFGKKVAPLVWPFKEKEISDFVWRMERYKSLFSLMLGTAEASRLKLVEEGVQVIGVHAQDITSGIQEMKGEVGSIKDGIRDVKDDTREIKHNVQDVKNNLQDLVTEGERSFGDRRRIEALNWLYPGACNERHLEISGRRKKDTGLWIFNTPEVQDWIQNTVPASRLIWGHGIPGAGKTFLSSLVIDRLREQAFSKQYGVAYIYFNYKEVDKQDPREVLANIVKQLACQIRELPKQLEEGPSKKPHEKPSLEDLYDIFTQVIKSFTKTFIICDALDECRPESRSQLLPLFHQMGKKGVNMFLTSRDYPEDIQESFSKITKIRIWARNEDIASYIKQKINDYPRARRLIEKGEYQERVVSEITSCACGMFLLVHFHIEHLCTQTTPRGFLQELGILGISFKGASPLNPVYDRAMEIIKTQSKDRVDLAFKVLSWLVMARRVLSIHKLQMAVSMEEGKTDFDEQEDLPEITTLLEVCASLVTMDEQSKTIRLAHYTVQEYLERYPTFTQDAKAKVSISCITFISLETCITAAFAGGNGQQSERRVKLFGKYPFLEYVVVYLRYHVADCGDETLSVMSLLRFLRNPEAIKFYHWISRSNIQPPLHLAAYLANIFACRILLEYTDVMLRDEDGNTPLHIASSTGYVSMIKFFLEKGADIEARNKLGKTVLHLAIQSRLHLSGANLEDIQSPGISLVKLLLENGANVNTKDRLGESALQLAVKSHWSISSLAKLLLENGANVNAENLRGESALQLAVEHQCIPVIVELLLKNGASVNAEDMRGQSALQLVVKHQDIRLVELLLEDGANFNAERGRLALQQALRHAQPIHSNLSLLKLILKNGVSFDTTGTGGDAEIALISAVQLQSEPLAKLLLGNGVDVNVKDKWGQPVLQVALKHQDESLVKLLLENGADVNARGWWERTALHLAVRSENELLAELLLENRADIEAKDYFGKTALQLEEVKKNKRLEKLLLRYVPVSSS